MIEDIKIIEQNNEYIAYDCDTMLYVYLKKWGVVSDHTHSHKETIFIIQGTAKMIVGDKTATITSPKKIIIPANTYHKFTALTDVIGLEIK